jgi:hypothetical protein
MNYQSGDRLKNRYLSNDAFTSLKNKLGGRSITSLGNDRKRNSFKMSNQGFGLLDYKSFMYKSFISILLLIICIYIIPQTRYFVHGYVSQKINNPVPDTKNLSRMMNENVVYDVAPPFLKTDQFISKQKDNYINDSAYVYDFFTDNLIGLTTTNSSSTINIKLFSDSGFKNNFLIEQEKIIELDNTVLNDGNNKKSDISTTTNSTSTIDTTDEANKVVKENNTAYQSYLFEGLGYGQLIAKVPPKTEVKKDTFIYTRTVDGLKPIAKIINVDEDNKSTFTIIYAQLIVSPQNIYKVIFK